ncbi:MAG: methyltransferase domain-containing protein [Kiritimatiellia bacterium]
MFFESFQTRATNDELMDLADCDEGQLFRTLDQFHGVNRLFSRVRGLLNKTILADMKPGTPAHLIDLGAGACDIPVWLMQTAKKRGLDLRITAIDADPRVVRYVRERYGSVPNLSILEHDALDLQSLAPFDYVFANHFLHHLPDPAVYQVLADTHRLARRGFVFSDLKRSPWSHLAFSVIAHIYRDSFTRADGLLSIRKGFRKEDFGNEAGMQIRTAFPGRIQLIKMP